MLHPIALLDPSRANPPQAAAATPSQSIDSAGFLTTWRKPVKRSAIALVTALCLVNLQWWQGVGPRSWFAEAQAQASVNSTLAVICVPQTKKQQDESDSIERLLSEAVGRLDAVRLFELSPIQGGDAQAKAAEQIEQALRALLLRTPKRAQERISAAAQALGDSPMAGDERLYARLFKAQALTWLANNDLVKSRDALVKSLTLFPSQTQDEYVAYGSMARDLYDAVIGGFRARPTGDLKVSARGNRGEIWVDSTYRGSGNATSSDIVAGAHRLTVRASGAYGERRFIEVTQGKVATADFDLKPAPFGPELEQGRAVLTANFTQPSVVEDRMRELRNQLGADQMLVIRPKLSKKSTELTGYFLSADGTLKKVDVVIEKNEAYLDKIAEFVASSVGAKLLATAENQPLDLRQSLVQTGQGPAVGAGATQIDPNAPLFQEPEGEKKVPITKKWWFWTAVAGGVALIGGGIYALSKGGKDTQTQATGSLKLNLNYLKDSN